MFELLIIGLTSLWFQLGHDAARRVSEPGGTGDTFHWQLAMRTSPTLQWKTIYNSCNVICTYISIMTDTCVCAHASQVHFNRQTNPEKCPRMKVHLNEMCIRHCTCYPISVLTSKAQHFTSRLKKRERRISQGYLCHQGQRKVTTGTATTWGRGRWVFWPEQWWVITWRPRPSFSEAAAKCLADVL